MATISTSYANSSAMKRLIFVILIRRLIPSAITIRFITTSAAFCYYKFMNYWTQLSIDFANQRNYLDELFSVYPTIPEGIRTISETLWSEVEQSFDDRNNIELFKTLFKFDLFPIKTIILASSNENDLVLDCFCGSGTTLEAAHQLGRKWIGIDQSTEAIKATQKRLSGMEKDLFCIDANYQFLQTV